MAKKKKIDQLRWGKIISGENEFHDVISINGQIEDRDYPRLKKLFGTGHKIGDWEIDRLFSNNPDIIIIGNGWAGSLEVSKEIKEKAKEKKVSLEILKSPKAVSKYNELIDEEKKVNALIHSTC